MEIPCQRAGPHAPTPVRRERTGRKRSELRNAAQRKGGATLWSQRNFAQREGEHARARPLVCYRTGLLCWRMYIQSRSGRYIHAVAPPPRTPGAASSEASPLCSAPRELGGSALGRPPCSRVGPHGCIARWLAQRREEVIRTGAKAATRGTTRRVKNNREEGRDRVDDRPRWRWL